MHKSSKSISIAPSPDYMVKLRYVTPDFSESFRFYLPDTSPTTTIEECLEALAKIIKEIEHF